ncbi:unnamed protein product [Gongylonema pulchrum]|uniref:Uncharacterized protein n=1 Tax=Gongylonema pulchrum TaxID=637853 RepID=A0A183D0I3_9BILA|nr:unnamed protein product [Gongylonema pulchrum]
MDAESPSGPVSTNSILVNMVENVDADERDEKILLDKIKTEIPDEDSCQYSSIKATASCSNALINLLVSSKNRTVEENRPSSSVKRNASGWRTLTVRELLGLGSVRRQKAKCSLRFQCQSSGTLFLVGVWAKTV